MFKLGLVVITVELMRQEESMSGLLLFGVNVYLYEVRAWTWNATRVVEGTTFYVDGKEDEERIGHALQRMSASSSIQSIVI